jgi:hypothetical protein
MIWLPYVTNLTNDIHCPRPEGLNITLVALNTSKEAIQEAERISRVKISSKQGRESSSGSFGSSQSTINQSCA